VSVNIFTEKKNKKLFFSHSINNSVKQHLLLSSDKYMQLNSALFSLNGGTGYVLQPEMMRRDSYDPHQEKKNVRSTLAIRVRHLNRITLI